MERFQDKIKLVFMALSSYSWVARWFDLKFECIAHCLSKRLVFLGVPRMEKLIRSRE